jgi:hypothetical protein
MDRGIRSPVLLMAGWLGIFLLAGPWFSIGGPPHRNFPQAALGIVLAVLVARGNRAARVMLILCSAAGVCAVLFGSRGSTGAQLAGSGTWRATCCRSGSRQHAGVSADQGIGALGAVLARVPSGALALSIAASAVDGLLITTRRCPCATSPQSRARLAARSCADADRAVGSAIPSRTASTADLHAACRQLPLAGRPGASRHTARGSRRTSCCGPGPSAGAHLAWLAPARERPPPGGVAERSGSQQVRPLGPGALRQQMAHSWSICATRLPDLHIGCTGSAPIVSACGW